MNIIYTKNYDKSIKKLKNYHKEKEELELILDYIRNKNSFIEIVNDPVSKIYGFERLKHQWNMYYSFRLSKVIRLIVRPKNNDIELFIIDISMKHYEDLIIKEDYYGE